MPADADAPPDLLTPLTASPAASASCARCSSTATEGRSGSSKSRSGIVARKLIGIGESRVSVLGRDLGHRDRARGEIVDIGGDVIGRHHRLPPPDEHAQSYVVAFGAFRFLDRAIAHFYTGDTERTATASARVSAGTARGRHQTVGEIGECGLVEQIRHRNSGTFKSGSGD